jgi:hypothetical protein
MFMHLLLLLSQISRERYGVDLAAPLLVARYLDVPPVAALALGLHPRHWPLVLWEPEEPCTAPAWPALDVTVILAAARDGCKTVEYDGEAPPEPALDQVRVVASIDGVTLKEAGRRIGYRLLTLDEIRAAVEAWMGPDLKMLAPTVSPKLAVENRKIAAAVVLGALRMAGGAIYVPEPQVVALLAGTTLQ